MGEALRDLPGGQLALAETGIFLASGLLAHTVEFPPTSSLAQLILFDVDLSGWLVQPDRIETASSFSYC